MSKDKEKELIETAVDETKEVKEKKPKNLKKLKFGSMSAAVVVIVIAIVIIVNLMSNVIMNRYPVKLDLTSDNRYELSEASIEVMKNLDRDVEITVTSTKDVFDAMATQYENMFYQYYGIIVEVPFEIIPEILEKYSVYAEAGKGSVNVRYVDINKNPDVITKIKNNYNGDITEGSIVFSCGDRVKVISSDAVASMIVPSQDSTQTNIRMTFGGESAITSSIIAVTDQNPVRTAFITTSNGASIFDQTHMYIASSFESFLIKNGYECEEIDIATDELSTEDYDLIVLCCPNIDFTEDVMLKLSNFLYNDGKYKKNFIYVPNYYATNLPNIAAFLEDWKISIDQTEVYDDNMAQVSVSALGAVGYAPVIEIADADSVGALANEALPIVAPGARSVSIISKNNDSIATEILKSSATSYLASEDGSSSSEKAAYNIVVKGRKEASEQFDVFGSEVLVIGSPFMLDNSILSNNNTMNNASVIAGIINNMTGKENTASIPEKSLVSSNLTLTQKSANVTGIITIFVIPGIVAVIGIAILLWRKNK